MALGKEGKKGKNRFTSPFLTAALALYLGVQSERSGVCRPDMDRHETILAIQEEAGRAAAQITKPQHVHRAFERFERRVQSCSVQQLYDTGAFLRFALDQAETQSDRVNTHARLHIVDVVTYNRAIYEGVVLPERVPQRQRNPDIQA